MSYLSGYDQPLFRALQPLDRPPRDPDPMDDEFDDQSFDTSKWTWLDQGSTTVDENRDGLQFTIPSTSARVRGIYQAAPTAPWIFRAKLYYPTGSTGSGTMSCLFAAENTTGEVRTMAWWLGSSQIRSLVHATPSSGAGGWGGGNPGRILELGAAVWVQMAYDGTTLLASWASSWGFRYDGVVSPAYTPTLIGLGIGSASGETQHRFGWFRRVL